MDALITNVYSEYSLLQSTNRVDELVQAAKEAGYTALSLTDRHVLYGAVPFFQSCRKAGLKPLLGLEVTVRLDEEIIPVRVVAKNEEGYRQLVAHSTSLGFQTKQAAIELETWKANSTACFVFIPKEAFVAAKGNWLHFWERLAGGLEAFIELAGGESDHELIQFANAHQIPCVAAPPTRFLRKEDAPVYQLVRAIGAGTTTTHLELEEGWQRWHLPTANSLKERFPEKALLQARALAEKVEPYLPEEKPRIPSYDGLTVEQADKRLETLCRQGLKARYKAVSVEAERRLEHELAIIAERGYSSYFLIVADFVGYAKKSGILTGPGRGSSASSIVAYTLFITDVDPLAHDLLFERFLNPERASLPDIDVDFPDYRRDEVIAYVRERFGHDRVAQVLTFGTFAARAAIRDVGKALSIRHTFVDRVAKSLTPASLSLNEAQEKGVFKGLESPELDELLFFAKQIEGLPRHASTHAAGVIISDKPLNNKTALQLGIDGHAVTQADMDSLARLGLVKFDFLGLRNLTLLERMLKVIEQEEGVALNLQHIPLNDKATFQLLQQGKSTGIFQLESAGMRQVLKQLQPSQFEDIVATSALYRPGPMAFIPEYIRGKHGHTQAIVPHESLRPIVEPTFGVLVYQEQIMQVVQATANYSLAEADLFRRAISKKQHDVIIQEKQQFIHRAVENGFLPEEAEAIFSLIERFANYGFPKSHATAYSFISYWLAYLRVHFPAAFFAALFSSVWQNHEKLYSYINEAKKEGIRVLPPSVCKSGLLFELENGQIRFGLLPISGVNVQAVNEIISKRRKNSDSNLFMFYAHVASTAVNKRVMEALIKAGALDEFGQSRATLLGNLDKAEAFVEQVRSFKASSGGLFTIKPAVPAYLDVTPSTKMEDLEGEREVLGFYLSGHPIENELERLAPFGRIPLAECIPSRKPVRIAGMVIDVKKIVTKKGEAMAFLTLSDESGECSCVAFPQAWKVYEGLFAPHALVFLEGVLEERQGKTQFIIHKAADVLQLNKNKKKQTLYIRLTADKDQPTRLSDLKYVLSQDVGSTQVILYREKEQARTRLADEYSVAPTRKTLQLLKQMFGEENIVLKSDEE